MTLELTTKQLVEMLAASVASAFDGGVEFKWLGRPRTVRVPFETTYDRIVKQHNGAGRGVLIAEIRIHMSDTGTSVDTMLRLL